MLIILIRDESTDSRMFLSEKNSPFSTLFLSLSIWSCTVTPSVTRRRALQWS